MSSRALAGLRARLHAPGPVYLAQTMFPDPGVSSILGACGFDFVMLDAEHGPFTLTSLRACIEALTSAGTAAVVRVASHSEVEIKHVLDLGACGVMIPRIESADEANAVVRAARYAPEGSRGVSGAIRTARFGLEKNYVSEANRHIAVIAIIESALGVQNAKEIVATAGLDGVMIGGDDLSADLGLFGQYTHPHVQESIEHVIACAMSAKIKAGSRPPRTPKERECMLIHCGNDAIVLRTAFEQALAARRATE